MIDDIKTNALETGKMYLNDCTDTLMWYVISLSWYNETSKYFRKLPSFWRAKTQTSKHLNLKKISESHNFQNKRFKKFYSYRTVNLKKSNTD